MPIRFDISSGPQSQAEQQTDLWALLTIPLSRFQHPLSSQTLLCISRLDIVEEEWIGFKLSAEKQHYTSAFRTEMQQIGSKGCWVFWDMLTHMIFETFPSHYCSPGTSQWKTQTKTANLSCINANMEVCIKLSKSDWNEDKAGVWEIWESCDYTHTVVLTTQQLTPSLLPLTQPGAWAGKNYTAHFLFFHSVSFSHSLCHSQSCYISS